MSPLAVCSRDDAQPTDESYVARRRTELDIGSGWNVSDDPAVAPTPAPPRRMAHRDPIAGLEDLELVAVVGVDRQHD